MSDARGEGSSDGAIRRANEPSGDGVDSRRSHQLVLSRGHAKLLSRGGGGRRTTATAAIPGAGPWAYRRSRGRTALSRFRGLRVAEAAAPSFHRRSRCGVLRRVRAFGRSRGRDRQAPLQRLLRHGSRAVPARAEDRAGDRRRREDQRLHPGDRAGRVRQRLRRRRSPRGYQLQPPASGGGLAGRHRALHRQGRVARRCVGHARMTSVAITGYASLDYVVRLDRTPVDDTTATILSRPLDWPRLGGSPAYVAGAMVAAGAVATSMSWVGDDADGRLYCEALASRGVGAHGIALRL